MDVFGQQGSNPTKDQHTHQLSMEQGSFQVARSLLVSDHTVPLKVWGIRRETTGDGKVTYATWAADMRFTPTLIVTRLTATKETFPELLEKMKEAAWSAGLNKVEVWNLPKELDGLAEGEGDGDGRKYIETNVGVAND